MIRPPIKKALEDKIIAAAAEHPLLTQIANLIIAVKNQPKKTADIVQYWQIERQFKYYLGDEVGTPPAPSRTWTAKLEYSYNIQGLTEESVKQIAANVRAHGYKPPYGLSWLVWNAERLLVPPSKALPSAAGMFTGRPSVGPEDD
jgi:hypothetical protein